MANLNTGISWADKTWPITAGCTHVTRGCHNCWAAQLTSTRLKHLPDYAGLAVGGKFTGEVRTLPHRLEEPLHWRKPSRVFVGSMSDLFHQAVSDEFIGEVFAVMCAAWWHRFVVLTKRHARMRALLSNDDWAWRVLDRAHEILDVLPGCVPHGDTYPLPNVEIGVSVEDQKTADMRIPYLYDTPAAVRWLSVEPLVAPLDLTFWMEDDDAECTCTRYVVDYSDPERFAPDNVDREDNPACRHHHPIDLVVVGGESGVQAQPMHPAWARAIRDTCVDFGVLHHFKQRGQYTWEQPKVDRKPDAWVSTVGQVVTDAHDALDIGGDWQAVWKVGAHRAGRDLDGRAWDDLPDPGWNGRCPDRSLSTPTGPVSVRELLGAADAPARGIAVAGEENR